MPETTSQAHQQSALQASVRDDFAGTDPGADSPGDWLRPLLSHSDSTASHAFSEVFSRGHSVPVPYSPVGAGFGPVHFFRSAWTRLTLLLLLAQ